MEEREIFCVRADFIFFGPFLSDAEGPAYIAGVNRKKRIKPQMDFGLRVRMD